MNIWRANRNRQLDEEIEAHIRMAVRDRVDRGQSYGEALLAARREFGNDAHVKEVTRGMWSFAWLESLLSDLRFAYRAIAKSPAWAAAVAVSLAVGVGANTAIFSLTYAIVLKNLPVPQPSRLIRYGFRNGEQDIGLSGPAYDALRRHQSACVDVLAWSDSEFSLDENGRMEPLKGGLLSGTGFRVLRLQPMLGSAFGDADDVPGGGPRGYQALISYAWWTSHFHQNPGVIGRSLRLNGRAVTIAGVLPEGFDGLITGNTASIVLPLAFDEVVHAPHPYRKFEGSFWLTLFGRLKPGQSFDSARANAAAIEPAVRKEADPKQVIMGGFFKPFHLQVESGGGGRSFLREQYQRPLLILELLAGMVLVLCCANTALLILAQMSSQAREFALRTALGAPRIRLFRLVLLEILMLAAAGLILATGLGWSLAQSLTNMLGSIGERPVIDVAPHAAIIVFTSALIVAAALASGLFAALRTSKADPAATLRQGGRTATSRRATGRWIVPAQVAVSVTLISAAIVLGASFLHLYLSHPGLQPGGLLFADIDIRSAKAEGPRLAQAVRGIVSGLGDSPGVEAATYLSAPPIHAWWAAGHYFAVDGRGAVHTDMTIWPESVSAGYLAAMGTRLREGQGFPANAVAADRTCILSESAARYFFPNDNAVGRFVYSGEGHPESDGRSLKPENACRVIGVAEDVPYRSLRETPPRMIYHILADDDASPQFTIAVRTRSTAQTSVAIRDVVHRMAPAAPSPTTYLFTELMDTHLSKERMLIWLSACFGGCALLLTAVGLYGLLMRSVTQRTQEIGIRMALGASRRSAVAAVLGMALRHVALGLAAGGAMAFAAARAMTSLLYGINPTDPRIYAGSILVLILTSLAATLIPARRAASVDPAEALRAE